MRSVWYTEGKTKSNRLARPLSRARGMDRSTLEVVEKLQDRSAAVLQHLTQGSLAILLCAQVDLANTNNEV
jgi:hypothetical protein